MGTLGRVLLLCCVLGCVIPSAALATFTFDLVDSENAASEHDLALDSSGRAHIGYLYTSPSAPGVIEFRYARESDSGWIVEVIDSGPYVARAPAIAVDALGVVHVVYIKVAEDFETLGLRYGWRDEGGWHFEMAVSGEDVERDVSMAMDSSGGVYVAYLDPANRDLKCARRLGGIWSLETVDSQGETGSYASLDVDSQGNPGIAYFNYDVPHLKYAWQTGGSWSIELVAMDNNLYGCSSLEIDEQDVPHLSFTTRADSRLTYAVRRDGHWTIDVVEEAIGEFGAETKLDLDSQGNPHVVYYERNNADLHYALRTPSGWRVLLVEDAGVSGAHQRLALDDADVAHVTLSQMGGPVPSALYHAVGNPVASVPASGSGPRTTRMLSCRPNPAAVETWMELPVSGKGPWDVLVHDTKGRLVRRLTTFSSEGKERSRWDLRDRSGRPVAAGLYWLKLHGTADVPACAVTVLR
jgi:hypothetical protein